MSLQISTCPTTHIFSDQIPYHHSLSASTDGIPISWRALHSGWWSAFSPLPFHSILLPFYLNLLLSYDHLPQRGQWFWGGTLHNILISINIFYISLISKFRKSGFKLWGLQVAWIRCILSKASSWVFSTLCSQIGSSTLINLLFLFYLHCWLSIFILEAKDFCVCVYIYFI